MPLAVNPSFPLPFSTCQPLTNCIHRFAHLFITRCIEKNIDVKVIAQWQDHQDGGKLILGTYSYVRNVHAKEMAKKLV